MIISASRRTDIPNYFSDWFFNRINEGFVLVRNPLNIHQISKIDLSPKIVDGIVFWTKNPLPMIERINELDNYNYYFQFTLNAYGKDVEPNVPSKNDIVIPTFQRLASLIGKEKLVWRYDPIFFNKTYTMQYHLKYFELLASKLSGFTEKCTVSFLDLYKNTERNIQPLSITQLDYEQQTKLMKEFVQIAKKYGIYIDTCAEKINLDNLGISHAHCIDKARLERIGNFTLSVEKDKNQREECGCVSSIDIGAYNTCKNSCLYCYANFSQTSVEKNCFMHNSASTLLFGEVGEEDIIKERVVKSYRSQQISFLNEQNVRYQKN